MTGADARAAVAGVTGLFDVAISFTAQDAAAAALADELASALRSRGLRTFYFRSIEEAARVLGERLSEALPAIYRDRALVVVLVASPNYGATHWTKVELDAALARPRDDDGQPRLIPVSADGTRIAALPSDLIHLGDRLGATVQVGDVVALLAERCGKRRRPFASSWPVLILVGAALLAGLQWGVLGAPFVLTPATGMAGLFARVVAVLATVVPVAWMRRRRSRAADRLAVVTEGPRLTGLRAWTSRLGLIWTASFLALATLLGAGILDARLRVRDIGSS